MTLFHDYEQEQFLMATPIIHGNLVSIPFQVSDDFLQKVITNVHVIVIVL